MASKIVTHELAQNEVMIPLDLGHLVARADHDMMSFVVTNDASSGARCREYGYWRHSGTRGSIFS